MEKYQYLFGTIFSFGIFMLVLWFSVLIPTSDESFYMRQYEKNHVYETTGISPEDMMKVTKEIIQYLQLRTDRLEIEVEIDSHMRPFYNERELAHMVDVQEVFRAGRNVAIVCLLISTLMLFLLRSSPNRWLVLAKCLRNTLTLLILVFTSFAVAVSTNFNWYFDQFHLIFFPDEIDPVTGLPIDEVPLWILDPATDLLINIVPLPFFIAIALYVAIILAVLSALIIAGCSLFLRYKRKERSICGL